MDILNLSLQDVIESLDQPMHIIDANGILVTANTAWEKYIHLSKKEALGQHINTIMERRNHGFYFSIDSDEEDSTTHITHFTKVVFGSVAIKAIHEQKRISMFTFSNEGRRVSVTSTPVFKDSSLAYVVTLVKDLTSSLDLRKEVDDAIEKSSLITAELDLYRKKSTQIGMVYSSPAMSELNKTLDFVSKTTATVLLTGESGVGKEVVANEIVKKSSRANKPFIKINCASIPESLIESELFGHEKGSYTGATSSKPGMFELSNHGTILLDEIGELPINLQPKLLRVLQEKTVMRIGGSKEIPIDVRVIAATNRDIRLMIDEGKFREDLYYRLNLIPIQIPPLRERKEDIETLANYFLQHFNSKYNKIKYFSPETIQIMLSYSWPGNIRELENIIERLIIIDDEPIISDRRISACLFAGQQINLEATATSLSLKERIEQYEKSILEEAAKKYGSSYAIAEALNSSQSTIARKLKQYGLSNKN